MHNKNINFAQNTIHQVKRRKKQHNFFYKIAKSILVATLILFTISFALSYKAIFSQETFSRTLSKLPVISHIKSMVGSDSNFITEDNNRVNFLLMGIGGADHDGALLTDTIMLASVKLSTKQIALISIPRDLYVKIPDNGWQRINHANAYGVLNDYPGGGGAMAAKTVEQTFGVPIDYYLRIDFRGFESVIDDIGGINVAIDRSFTDAEYPTDDHLVQTISFEKGIEHMDGKRALQFARSRHGDNWEGSDFARSKRQQKILLAVKNKLFNWKTLINPNRLYSIFNNVTDHTDTNIEAWQLPELANLLKSLDYGHIEHQTIDDSPGGLLKPLITEDGAQVLAPKSSNLDELKEFVRNIFVVKNIIDHNIKIIIANGTNIEGLATYTGSALESWGFTIARLTNSPNQDFEKTVIYDLTDGNEKEALQIIKSRMKTNASKNIPEYLKPLLYKTSDYGEENKIDASFLIVTGTDQETFIKDIEEWRATEKARLEAIASSEEGDEDEKEMKE